MKRILAGTIVLLLIFAAGCAGTESTAPEPSYSVSEEGVLMMTLPAPEYEENILAANGTITLSEIIFTQSGKPVAALLAMPDEPVAGIVFAPGAGVVKEAHKDRAMQYADKGIAFLALDIRGNGGETAGHPLNLQADYEAFATGAWPQTYQTVGDMTGAAELLKARADVLVYAMGSSNGAMYATIAAANDPTFAGYIGVSATGFNNAWREYPGDAGIFLRSVDADAQISRIAPRPVHLLHAPADEIIPYENGERLFTNAGEPKTFTAFNGSHGLNDETDKEILISLLNL